MKNLNSIGEQITSQAKQLGTQPTADLQTWGVTAVAAVAGGFTLSVAAPGLVAVVTTLAFPPVALSVGAIVGGLLGWRYTQRRQSAVDAATQDTSSQGIAVQAIVETATEPDRQILPLSPVSEENEPAAIDGETLAAVVMEPPAERATVNEINEINESEAGAESASQLSAEAPPPQPPVTPSPDKLEAIHGIGPGFAKRLRAAGIHTFAQLAELSPEQVKTIIAPVRSGQRVEVGDWIAEARQRVAQGNQMEMGNQPEGRSE